MYRVKMVLLETCIKHFINTMTDHKSVLCSLTTLLNMSNLESGSYDFFVVHTKI